MIYAFTQASSFHQIKCLEKYDGKGSPYAYVRVYSVAMAQYGNDDKLLVQISMKPHRDSLAWFTKIETSKIKIWIDLAHLFVEKYKFNIEIAPDK